jgi:GNAT superfamily N-acetyltransferase
MQFMNLELARRVEFAEAAACRECAEAFHAQHPEFPVAVEEIGGGVACFAGAESPITQAIGFGLKGSVEDSDFDRLGEFFLSRNAPAAAEICPLVEMSLYEKFATRGYRLLEVSDVLIKSIDKENVASTATASPAFTIRPACRDEAKLWTRTVAQGFAEHFPVTPEMLDVMEGFFLGKNSRPFLALVDGEAAGGAAMTIHDGVCGLFGASTLPDFRGRGIQTALLAARISVAANEGCDLAVSIAQPGSISHRNIERSGFRVAYTRTKLIRPLELKA